MRELDAPTPATTPETATSNPDQESPLQTDHLTTRRHVRMACLVLVSLVLAACGPSSTEPDAPDEPDQPTESTEPTESPSPDEPTSDPTSPDARPEDDVAAMAFTDCEAERYTVGYPAEWNTNSDDGLLGPCEIFHPGEIEVPEPA